MTTFRTIVISDVHLGTKDSKAEHLNNFLKLHSCETLYLAGDIIDGWRIQQNKWKWKQSHTTVVRRILGLPKKGTRVVYITGNHDEFLRSLIPFGINLGNIDIVDKCIHYGLDNKKYLVIHGDLFDGITKIAPWIAFLGDKAYDFVLELNSKFNWCRRRIGLGYWSLSKYLKHRVKQAVNFLFQFEINITEYAKSRNYDGVICGHTHCPTIKTVNNIQLMNSGDWVESMTALVEHHSGQWEIITWTQISDEHTNDQHEENPDHYR